MKNKLFVMLVLICSILLSITVLARDTTQEESMAASLKSLNLFKGVSETEFDLDRAPTRVEALVMLIRTLGKENEVLNDTFWHPFKDVPSWADRYVGYAYQTGLTNGISETEFGTGNASSAMYITFILRALNYSDKLGDFSWDNPYTLAQSIGILPDSVDINNFLRADVVSISYAALSAYIKQTSITLADHLVSAGVFSRELYESIRLPVEQIDYSYEWDDPDFIDKYLETEGFTFTDERNNTYGCILAKNNSHSTVSVSINSVLYGINGNAIGACDAEILVLGPGETSVGIGYIGEYKRSDISGGEYTIFVKEQIYYDPILSLISFEETKNRNNIIIAATNNSDRVAHFVEAIAFFWDESNHIIWHETEYIGDRDYDIQPGTTIYTQIDCPEIYDHVDVYYAGYSKRG